MVLKIAVLLLAPILLLHLLLSYYTHNYALENVERDGYFGSGKPKRDQTHFSQFQVSILEDEVENAKVLTQSVLRRMVEGLEGAKFENGFNVNYLVNLTNSFLEFDWQQHQTFLNTFVHKQTQIEGLAIHFIKSEYPKTKDQERIPIVMIHDIYGSFWDFYKVLPFLANPARFGFDFGTGKKSIAFEVVVPSLPGFLFSDRPQKKGVYRIFLIIKLVIGFGAFESARLIAKLMDRLGYLRYFVYGQGQLGGYIASNLGLIRSTAIRGIILTNPKVDFSGSFWLKAQTQWRSLVNSKFSAFAHQLTNMFQKKSNEIKRPDTLGIMLNSSPLALIAWIGDRWAEQISFNYSNHIQGELQSHSTVDEFLTEVYLYWLTGCSTSALRVASVEQPLINRVPVQNVSVAINVFDRSPQTITEIEAKLKFPNLKRFNLRKGGGLVSFENPKLLAELIFSFVEEQLIEETNKGK
ncbi:Epoxide hydrolase 1 [Aphelenchoides besseyi]|nr:Epoxide hydrolase 1 [Aphelenchoides besseyi]